MMLRNALLGIAVAVAPLLPTASLSAPVASPAPLRTSQIVSAASSCPTGQHLVRPGYTEHNRWRPAHCAKNTAVR